MNLIFKNFSLLLLFEAQNEAAKSGNRPKFKQRRRRRGQFAEPPQPPRSRRRGQEAKAIISSSSAGNKYFQENSSHQPRGAHPGRPPCARRLDIKLIGPAIALLLCLGSSINCDLHQQQRQPGSANLGRRDISPPAGNSSSGAQLTRVAALTTKLEQWFICHRAQQQVHEQQLLQQQLAKPASTSDSLTSQPGADKSPAPLPAGPAPTCAAHFDGHLCWPETRVGQTARLPCPKLSWLKGDLRQQQQHEQENSLKINVIGGENSSSAAGQDKGPSAEKSNDKIDHQELKFAHRDCSSGDAGLANNQSTATERQTGHWANEANYSNCLIISKDDALAGDDSAAPEAAGKSSLLLFDPTDEWIKLDRESDKKLFSNLAEELERIEGAIDPYSDPDLQEQWSLCIGNIMRHQDDSAGRANSAANRTTNDLSCSIIFDGWRCWPSTPAGQVAYVSCPRNQPGFSAEREAHKICTVDGTWYKHPLTNRYWSNYTTCVDTADLAFRTKILNLYVIGNLISLVALSASLIIFISFKSLNCTRVTIHKNLFLSFITNNLMWIIWYNYVVNDADLLQSNPIECQLWHILLHYFLVSNYFWMFCEGLYLHTLLVVAFVSEDKILKWFYLLGWLTPVPITLAYAYNRSYDEYYTNFCWMEESPHNLILMAPIGISLLLNLIFLINIVRVLVTKLRANNSPDTHQTRKAVRATLILIPLLGLHYILTPFRPEAKSEWEGIYESIAAVCTSFQGLCVALLFCFCNGEVIAVIKKKLKASFNIKSRRNQEFNNHYANNVMRSRSNTVITTTTIANSNLNSTTALNQNHRRLSSSTTHLGGSNGQQQLLPPAHNNNKLPQCPIFVQSNGATSLISPSDQIKSVATGPAAIGAQGQSTSCCKNDNHDLVSMDNDHSHQLSIIIVNNNQDSSRSPIEEETVQLLKGNDDDCSSRTTTSFNVK